MKLALIGNLSVGEAVVILILAVLVFGRRLPEVAARVLRGLQDLRRNFERLRRETGIDEELRKVSGSLSDLEREARLPDPLRAPREPRRERAWQRPVPASGERQEAPQAEGSGPPPTGASGTADETTPGRG